MARKEGGEQEERRGDNSKQKQYVKGSPHSMENRCGNMKHRGQTTDVNVIATGGVKDSEARSAESSKCFMAGAERSQKQTMPYFLRPSGIA